MISVYFKRKSSHMVRDWWVEMIALSGLCLRYDLVVIRMKCDVLVTSTGQMPLGGFVTVLDALGSKRREGSFCVGISTLNPIILVQFLFGGARLCSMAAMVAGTAPSPEVLLGKKPSKW